MGGGKAIIGMGEGGGSRPDVLRLSGKERPESRGKTRTQRSRKNRKRKWKGGDDDSNTSDIPQPASNAGVSSRVAVDRLLRLEEEDGGRPCGVDTN